MMRLQRESRALRILAKLPMRWMVLSARMMRVLVAFSMAFLVFPFSPEIRAMHRARWSPWRFLTSLIWKVSRKRSSSRSMAMASSKPKPSMNARRKSQVRWMADRSSVSSHSRTSTVLFLRLRRTCSFMFLTTVSQIFSQLALRGVMRFGGIITDCCSKAVFPTVREGRGFSAVSIICSACIVEGYRFINGGEIARLILSLLSFLFIRSRPMKPKRKQQEEPPRRTVKPVKGMVEDVYPFELAPNERMSHELRQYINELQREYIDRYNVLLANRTVFAEVIESVARQLDGNGVESGKLEELCRSVSVRRGLEQEEDMPLKER